MAFLGPETMELIPQRVEGRARYDHREIQTETASIAIADQVVCTNFSTLNPSRAILASLVVVPGIEAAFP